jgi:hypothetical protein
MTSVTTEHQLRSDRERAVRRLRAQPYDPPALFDHVCRFGVLAQVEAFVAPTLLSQEVEEIPLRHQGDELAARRYMAEIPPS